MLRNIIRYVVLTIVVIGIVVLMGSLVNGESSKFNSTSKKESNSTEYYTASIKVMDKETKQFLKGGNFVLKTNDGEVIAEWESTENIKRITKLENGTYVLEQKSATNGYEKTDKITFKIYNSDKDVVVYNEKVEEKVTSNEINVDNTLSTKSFFGYIIAIITIGYGFRLIINKKVPSLGK